MPPCFIFWPISLNALQNGIECLTIIIRKDCHQVVSWKDGEGRNGLDYVLNVVAKLLESQDEAGGLVIGDLIIHLFRKAGETILPVLPQLLRAMVVRMKTAKTATFLQVCLPLVMDHLIICFPEFSLSLCIPNQ